MPKKTKRKVDPSTVKGEYDKVKPKIKSKFDKCQHPGCTSKAPVEFLSVVRIDRWEDDTEDNLTLVCRNHKPDWES